MRRVSRGATVVLLAWVLGACAHVAPLAPGHAERLLTKERRLEALERAQVWSPVDVVNRDLRLGPQGDRAFAPDEAVTCDYSPRHLSGTSPKFACALDQGDEVKVKYGEDNGEVYASVASTRLFWALGFGADGYYPVRVTCRGCPDDPWRGPARSRDAVTFDAAIIERKMKGRPLESKPDEGWSWDELDSVDPTRGGAPLAHRDALRLLAALVQHSDSKAVQQRLVCRHGDGAEKDAEGACGKPFLLVHDLGVTFGRAGLLARHLNTVASMNFERWAPMPVWKDPARCVANLPKSFSGTLRHPKVHEAGRRFLADLLAQLSDAQLHDLFAVARVDRRPRHPGHATPPASVDEWVDAFKRKRAEIVDHTCPE